MTTTGQETFRRTAVETIQTLAVFAAFGRQRTGTGIHCQGVANTTVTFLLVRIVGWVLASTASRLDSNVQ